MTEDKNYEPFLMDTSYTRASTARVDDDEYLSRVKELCSSITSKSSSINADSNGSGAICEFDLSKNVLDYLPHPMVTQSALNIGAKSIADATNDADSIRTTLLGSSKFLGLQSADVGDKAADGGIEGLDMDPQFESLFEPTEMRLLALVSHNNMKHAMKQFVVANKNVLKKFRLTGTNTTMTMLREVFGDDPEVVYGPACKSGPLGGDAQLVALAVTGQLGGCIFFIDPMDAHPHSADIECLVRQGNVHNILMMNNPTTAHICLNTLRVALKMGRMEMFPSFFFDLESPSVEAYKMRQTQVLQSAICRNDSIGEMTGSYSTRDSLIEESMERANKMSLQFRAKNVTFLNKELKDLEEYLPIEPKAGEENGGRDETVTNVMDMKKGGKKGKKKKFLFFGKSRIQADT